MPTVNFSKKELKRLTGIDDDEDLKDQMAMFGTDLENMTKEEVEVEIFPNRPDMLSLEGFALGLRGYLGKDTGLYEFNTYDEVNYKASKTGKVNKVRPNLACAVVKNLDLQEKIESVMQLQEKLHVTHGRNRKKVAIGIHDLDAIKGPFTYTTESPEKEFTPLQRSSNMKMDAILSEHKKGKKYRHLVEEYDEYPVWIDDDEEIFSMPPIINSKKTKVTKDTENVLIDVTGIDKKAVDKALNMVLLTLNEIGGEIHSVDLDEEVYPDLDPNVVEFDPEHVEELLGIDLSENEIIEYLERMGHSAKVIEDKIKVKIPSYRTDILHENDLIEDIGISHGYNNFERKIPDLSTVGNEKSIVKFKRDLRSLMTGMELLEVKNYYLSNKNKLFAKMEMETKEVAEAENALSQEHSCLRNWILPSLMEVYGDNQHRRYPQKLFEIGKTFEIDKNESLGVNEKDKLAGAISKEEAGFTEIKEILNSIFRNLGTNFEIKETQHDSFIKGRSGAVETNGIEIGYIGEIKPEVLINWEVKTPVAAFEIDINSLFDNL